MTVARALASVGMLALLTACQDDAALDAKPLVRPVLSAVVVARTDEANAFAGTIAAEHQADLAFRHFGRMIARDVKAGDWVKKGQRLAALDTLAFELAVRSSTAALANAQARLANETAILDRQRILTEQGHVSPSQLELAQSSRQAAVAAVAQAQANLTKAEDQLRDAELRAEFDGVVTTLQSEVGQVVQAGQTVVTMARPDSREAVVDMPDHLVERLPANARFEIVAQHDPSIRSVGRLREAGAVSDPLTRTRRMRIALDEPQPGLRLGTTVTAALVGVGAARVEIPAASLIERDGRTSVWLVDPVARAVFPQEVIVAGRHGDRIEVSEGLVPGARVAIAGLNSLTPGQSVKIPNEERQ